MTEYGYDCKGNLERLWDANHPSAGRTNPPTQIMAYDLLDRPVSVTQPWAGTRGGNMVTSYAWGVQDNLVQGIDANGTVTSYVYSDRDRLTRVVSEESGTADYTYNEHGRLASIHDSRGVTITRVLDPSGRVTLVDHSEAALETTYLYECGKKPLFYI